jgi:hypothetical protein
MLQNGRGVINGGQRRDVMNRGILSQCRRRRRRQKGRVRRKQTHWSDC